MKYSHLGLKNAHIPTSTKFLNRILGSLVTIGMFLPFPLMATTYTVTTPNDPTVNPDGTIAGGGTSLRSAILKANASGAPGGTVGAGNTINFDPVVFAAPQTINITRELPLVFSNVNVQGPSVGVTVDGTAAGVRRGVFVSGLPNPAGGNPNGAPQPIAVTLSNVVLQNMHTQGGTGGDNGGGGGMGAGGAIFVNSNATVTLDTVSFANNQAVGGNGSGIPGAIFQDGGGGGLGGNGGSFQSVFLGAAHGAGGGIGGNGGVAAGGIGGDGGDSNGFSADAAGGGGFGGNGIGQILNTQGFAAAGTSSDAHAGGLNGGGGGGASLPGAPGDGSGKGGNGGIAANGGGGGLGGTNGVGLVAGNGGIGGGGAISNGNAGGFGGFGGGGGNNLPGFGGGGGLFGLTTPNGGFGGGGGSVTGFFGFNGGTGGFGGGGGSGAAGGFGGGTGAGGRGGGGAAMGGGIFVVAGGTVNIQGNSSLSGSTLTGGTSGVGGVNGQAFGAGIFLQGNGATLIFNPASGKTQTYSDQIADQTGVGGTGANAGAWSLTKSGAGTLTLSANNLYSGGTLLNGGKLNVNADTNLGTATGSLTFNSGTLQVTGTTFTNTPRTIVWHGGGFDIANAANTFTVAQNLTTAGALTKIGPGTLVLSGANTYTGGTFLNGGTLAVAANTNLGNGAGGLSFNTGTLRLLSGFNNSRPVALTAGNGIIDTQAFNSTFSGLFSGSGGFTKIGTGNLTLAGANSYSGLTTINNGTLTFTGSTSGLGGGIANNAALIFNQNANSSFNNVISGTGPLTQVGPATLILGGVNTYTGGTILQGGELSVSADANLGNAAGSLTFNGGTLQVTGTTFTNTPRTIVWHGGEFDIANAANTFTVAQNLTTAGALTKTGPGTLVLTGSNTYTGGTFLNGGILSISTDANLGDASSPLTFNGGTLETTTSLTSARNMTLNAPGGTFQVDAGTTTLSGIIGGVGGLTKTGTGTLSLPNVNTYAGNTNVNQGILSLNGSLPNSAVFVSSGAALKGNGSMKSLNLSGTISPGNSIGTQTITNNFIMNPSSTYFAEISADGTSDLIKVGGTAQLNGTLNVVSVDGRQILKDQTYTILTAAGGRLGQFVNAISTGRIKYTVNYLSNAVKIVIGAVQDLADAFSSQDNSNAAKTARYLDTFVDNAPAGSDLATVTAVLDGFLSAGNTPALKAALNQIQPSLFREFSFLSFGQAGLMNKTVRMQQQYRREGVWYTSIEGVPADRLAAFQNLVDNQPMKGFFSKTQSSNPLGKTKKKGLAFAQDEGIIRGTPVAQRIRNELTSVWIEPFGQLNDKGHNSHGGTSNGNVGIKSHTAGFSLGGDLQIFKNGCQSAFVGLLGGYSNTPFDWKMHRGNGHMNTYNLGAYGTWIDGGFYVDAQVIGGQNRFKSFRNIAFGSIKRSAREHHRAFQLSTDGEIGYAIPLEALTFQPFFNLDYILVHEKQYKERGAQSLNLAIKSKTSHFLQGELGATFYHTYVFCDTLFRPAFQLGWVQKRPVSNGKEKGGLIDQPQTLTVLGDSRVRNQLAPALSLTAQFPSGLNVTANVSAEVLGGQSTGEALLKIGYDF